MIKIELDKVPSYVELNNATAFPRTDTVIFFDDAAYLPCDVVCFNMVQSSPYTLRRCCHHTESLLLKLGENTLHRFPGSSEVKQCSSCGAQW